jgi:hypothetical protein
MELSAQLPLELIALNDYFLGQWNANSEYQRTFHSEFVPLLAGFISRCGSITLNDAIPSLLKCITVTEAIHGAANLRELYIRHSRYLCEKPVFRDGLILRLQTLQVADLGPYCSLFRMAPISELRQLILTKSGGTDFLDVLHVLPNLLNLEFLKAHIHSLNRQEIPESVAQNLPVALPTLREAVLHLVDYNQQWPHTPSSSWSFFVYLTAPILKVLHVAAVGTRDVSAAGKLGAFCERSPSLGIFKLETSLALDDIKAVIRAVSGLRSLVIPTIGKRSLNEVGVLLGFLTAGACGSNSKDSLLPCLEYLTVPGCDSVTPADLLELFHSRCRQTASNKSISTSEGFASPDTHSPITATLKEVDFVTKSNQMDHFFQEDVLAQLQAGGCSLRWFPRYRVSIQAFSIIYTLY